MLGVTKALLNSWLDTKNSSCDFYIGKEVNLHCELKYFECMCHAYNYLFLQTKLMDERLSCIKVPDLIKRPPRCLKERKHWKGRAACKFIFVFVFLDS